jgi:hypothetical protein
MYFPVLLCCFCKQNSPGFWSCGIAEGFVKVNPWLLEKALNNPSSFVFLDVTVDVLFEFEDLSAFEHNLIRWKVG